MTMSAATAPASASCGGASAASQSVKRLESCLSTPVEGLRRDVAAMLARSRSSARIVKQAAAKGVIFIAAAGNNGPKAAPVYPAAYREVIAVTATDEKDRLYGKANRGDYICIAALKGGYDLSSGTSMAAAHVSGVVALLLDRDGKLDWSGAREILSSSARKPDASNAAEAFGAGILDAASALGAGR